LAVVCGLALLGAPAQASETDPSRTVESAVATFHGRPISDPDTAHALATAYWTPARMRAATPVEPPENVETPEREAADRPGRVGEPRTGAEPAAPRTSGPQSLDRQAPTRSTATPPGAVASRTASQSVSASPGVGRIFFTDANGGDHSCSGAAVNNPTANMVATAGHCVHPGDNSTWFTNWVYVPYYDYGYDPYGMWTAKNFTSVKGWTKWGFVWWDFAFVTMHPLQGKKLVHVTGGQGISFNFPKQLSVTLLGYPGLPPYDGGWQHYCQGTTVALAQRIGLDCPMTKGASGGPFLRAYDNSTGYGFVNTVISHRFGAKLYGPYFEEDVADVYDMAKYNT